MADSKKLSEKRREAPYEDITNRVLAWSVGRSEAYEINQINIFQATLLAM